MSNPAAFDRRADEHFRSTAMSKPDKAIPASKVRPSRKAPARAPKVRTASGVKRAATEVKPDLAGVLEQLKAYRRADPQFKQA
jgi:hypothetical protein